MKTYNKKRGFTIIELVVVVAVIAILSAVLIPTFAGIIKKSRLSADETAVYNMNTLLAGEEDADDLEDLKKILEENGYDLTELTPLSKDYSFVYAPELNKVLLVSKDGVVYPKAYAGETISGGYVTLATDRVAAAEVTTVAGADEAALAGIRGGVVTVENNIELPTAMTVSKDLTVNLTANVAIPTDTAGDGVFTVKKGATLTLNGTGTVNGVCNNDDGYNMAVWADGGEVVINGGFYTNVDAGTDDQYDLIYVKNGGEVIINGGSFKCQTPDWTLNCHDTTKASIVIAGGEFFEFDPSNLPANLSNDDITIADGYTVESEVRADGTWYKVVKVA